MYDNNEPIHESGSVHKTCETEQPMQCMPSLVFKQATQDQNIVPIPLCYRVEETKQGPSTPKTRSRPPI